MNSNRVGLAQRTLEIVSECDPLPPADRRLPLAGGGLNDLFRDQRSRLFRLFARRTDPGDADDLVQEVFARYASRSRASSEAVTEPEAYLTRVATNLLRDRARLAVSRATTHHQLYDDTVIAGPDPVLALEARDALRRLEVAVGRLRPRTRTVFLLQRVEGLTYPQIAERTGMSVKAVKKQMAKALFFLRRELGPL